MAFQVKQEKFEGPLGLLLELIEKEKLSISEISLARVTDDYVRYVKSLERLDPEELAEFLVVAAQLMLVKSRALIPTLQFSEEEEASVEELTRRLEEYKRMREFAKGLKSLEGKYQPICSREAYLGMDPVFYPPPRLTLAALSGAFRSFLAALPKVEKLIEEKIRRVISLEEKVAHIRSFLHEVVERAFSEIVRGAKEKVEVIVSFLAILELAKQKFVELHQDKPFAEITVKKI